MPGTLRQWATVDTGAFDFKRRNGLSARRLTFRQFVDLASGGRFQWYDHAERLAAVLQRVADNDLHRVMVFMPPRHGKSEEVSRLFPAYYLHRHPERWVGLTSYESGMAYGFSRNAREHFTRVGGKVKADAGQVRHWETERGGGLWAAGVGGPITGKGGHLLIIDDPLKNAEEAQSETVRAKQKDWYDSTFSTREEPGGAIVVVQTRWNEDDLSGWLLGREGDEDAEPERWHIVHFAAQKEAEPPAYPLTCSMEPDPRKPGAPLCPERYSHERLERTRKRLGSYWWNALFQQTPTAREGGTFKRAWLSEFVDAAPARAVRVRWWDRASTEGAGDWTAGGRVALADGLIYIEDMVRGQWSPGERDKIIRQAAELDRQTCGLVHTWSGQEPGSGGKDAALAFVRLLTGYPVHTEPETGSKEVRAEPLASQAEAGNVRIVRGAWNAAFVNEMCDFPTGKHDDQVDAVCGAYNKLARIGPRSSRIVKW